MRNRILKSLAILAACTSVLILTTPGYAQFRSRDYSRWEVDRLIRQAQFRSDRFAAMIDSSLGTDLEESSSDDRLSMRTRNLERQLDIVRQAFNETRDFRDVRSEVSTALNMARRVDYQMRRANLDSGTERQWMMLRSDLNQLARAFDLPSIGY